jgi:Putative phage abortive infection protein
MGGSYMVEQIRSVTTDSYSRLERRLLQHIGGALILLVVVGLLSTAATLWYYRIHFPGPPILSNDRWSQFGSFFGGTAGPLLSFLALVAIALTLWVQSVAYRNTAKALEAERASSALRDFRTSVFDLLRLYNDIVLAIHLRRALTHEVTAEGRSCFQEFYNQFKSAYQKTKREREVDATKIVHDIVAGEPSVGVRKISETELLRIAYEVFFRDHQHEVGHYFRTLYRIVRFIDEGAVDGKRWYTGILRAQLSTFEITLLFYNCLSDVGRDFKRYVEKYCLLDNLNCDLLIDTSHRGLYAENAYGDSEKRGVY